MNSQPSSRLKLAGIGCGGRTRTYLTLASRLPHLYQITAVADPVDARMDIIEKECGFPSGLLRFRCAEELFQAEKLADVVIIGTQDRLHHAHCLAALRCGYDVLLEKPIATSPEEIHDLEREAKKAGRKVLVCHVLRYTTLYRKVKELLDSGIIGEIVHLAATEGVGPWHQAHSFVRGHWAVVEHATPMIISKCCHDLDIIVWLLGDRCKSVSSFGSLQFFQPGKMPAGATLRCTDGCPHVGTCAFDAHRYLREAREWLPYIFDRAREAPDEEIVNWLHSSPWGRCVYRCENTAVDRQVVNMEFEGGAVAQLTMTAFATGRDLEVHGTKGVIRAGEAVKAQTGSDISVIGNDGQSTTFTTSQEGGGYDGHGGGDAGLVNALYEAFSTTGAGTGTSSLSVSMESHFVGFAAEASRKDRRVVDMEEFRASSQCVGIVT